MKQLNQAVVRSKVNLIKSLLQDGEKVNELDEFGWTLLHYAVLAQNLEAVKILLEAGADPNARGTASKESDVSIEIDESTDPKFRSLKEHASECTAEKCKHSVIFLAVLFHPQTEVFDEDVYCKILNLLFNYGADGDFDVKAGKSYFHEILNCDRNTFKLHIDHYTKLKNISKASNSPTFQEFLVKSKYFDINVQGPDDLTPLHKAVSLKKKKEAKWLINNGADVEIACRERCTPLTWAMENECTKLVRLLLKKGARVASKLEYLTIRKIHSIPARNYLAYYSELGLMKRKYLVNNVPGVPGKSFYDILISFNVPTNLVTKGSLVQYEEYASPSIFPRFHDEMMKSMKKVLSRRRLLKRADADVGYVLGLDECAFHVIIKNIIPHLRNKDLRVLASL